MKRFLIFLGILLAGAGGFVAYNTWFQQKNISIWTLVPENALLVYESTTPAKAWADFSATNIGKNLQSIEAFSKPGQFLSKLDTILGDKVKAAGVIEGKPFIVSLHSTGSNTLDVLLMMEVSSLENHTNLRQILDYFSEKNGFSLNKRNYQGYVLSEIRSAKEVFTFLYYQNFIIGSFTPFLVEDAIRNIEKESVGFFESNGSLLGLSRLQNDQGNLYVNTRRISRLAETFVDEILLDLDGMSSLGQSSFMDVRTTGEQLMMNGFTVLPAGYSGYLAGMVSNTAQPLDMEDLVSNRTAVYLTLTFESAEKWNEQMTPYWETAHHDLFARRDSSRKKYDVDIASLFEGMGTQAGLSLDEYSFGAEANKVFYLETKDLSETLKQFDQITERINTTRGDTLYYENYAEYTIKQMDIAELPYQLFGKPFDGFPSLYYTGFRNFVLGANSVQALKNALDDLTNENTWGKSVRINSFLDNTLSEANLSVFIHTPRAWNMWQQNLDDTWKEIFANHAAQLKAIDLLAVQFSFVEDKFYTSLVLQQTEKPAPIINQKPLLAENSVRFAQKLITRPFVVRNHNDRSLEVMVQDGDSLLYLLSSQQEVLWTDSLNGVINSPVYQIDYYKNDKLQYLFSTPREIYAIDRTGEYLPGFPVAFPGKNDIAFFSLVDYDKSKNYRYFIADTKGNLYITDKDGTALEGWAPREGDFALASAPFHLRVRGQDYLVALQANGVVQVFNRRGQAVKGFPLDLKTNISNAMHVEVGSGNANTVMTTITDDGSIIQLSLAGQLTKREQLYRPSSQSKFSLVTEATGKGYIFTRQDDNRIAILDKSGTVLFEKDYISSARATTQFYNFGSGRLHYIVNDPVQAFSYMYNEKGDLVNLRPIETGFEVGILYYEADGLYKIYRNYGDEFAILSLNK